VLYYVFVETIKLLAPFVPFLSESMYQELVGSKITGAKESIHLTDYPVVDRKFIEEYDTIEEEMKIVRKICEMGHILRTQKLITVRQPLSQLEVRSTNQVVNTLSEWMREMIQNEVNVKEALDKMNVEQSEDVLVQEEPSLGIKIGLNIRIDQGLKDEGTLRELTRSIQALRKQQ